MRNFLFKKKYNSFDDITLYNWIMCQKVDSRYVYIADNYDNLRPSKATNELYEKMYEEFFNQFCVTENLLDYMKEHRRVLLMEVKAYVRNDRSLLTIAAIKRRELNEKYKDKNKVQDYDEVVALVEQDLKMFIDKKKMTAKEFHTHVKIITERNKPKPKPDGKQNKG